MWHSLYSWSHCIQVLHAACKVTCWLTAFLCWRKELKKKKKKKRQHVPQVPFSASSLKFPSRGFPSSPQFHLEFSGLIEELHGRVYYRLRSDPFYIWSAKELLVRSLWVHLSHMWSFLQNQYGYFSVWQVNMKYHIIIEKQSCTFKHTQYSYLQPSLQLCLMDILEYAWSKRVPRAGLKCRERETDSSPWFWLLLCPNWPRVCGAGREGAGITAFVPNLRVIWEGERK